MSSPLEPILKFNGVLHHCDHGLLDGPRHFGQSFLRVTSRLLVSGLEFVRASALLGVSVHVGLSFAGSSGFSAQESRHVRFSVVSQLLCPCLTFCLHSALLCCFCLLFAQPSVQPLLYLCIAPVRTVPYFLMGSFFGCLVPCFLMSSLSGWCFVWLDLLGSPGADGFSCAFGSLWKSRTRRLFSAFSSLPVCCSTTRVGLQGHCVNELYIGADPETQRCTAPV